MYLLFLFDKDTRIEKTLIQTLACQLPSTLIQHDDKIIGFTKAIKSSLGYFRSVREPC